MEHFALCKFFFGLQIERNKYACGQSNSWFERAFILSDKGGRWGSKLAHHWPVRKTARPHCLGLSPPLGWQQPPSPIVALTIFILPLFSITPCDL